MVTCIAVSPSIVYRFMNELIRFNWQAFDPAPGAKVLIGLVLMLVLTSVTGQPWLATGLVVLFAWLTNVPGPLKDRIAGMMAFAAAATAITYLSGQLGSLALWPSVFAMAIIGFLGTLVLAWGTRAYMVGYVVICWAIYGPSLVTATSVGNCILAIVAGTGVMIALILVEAKLKNKNTSETPTTTGGSPSKTELDFIIAYSITVALVLALTAYMGWTMLDTNPVLIVGGAFFVMGFDVNKTLVAGIARAIAVVAGAVLGLTIGQLLGSGLIIQIILIAFCFLSFATAGIHPSALMFFLTAVTALGWQGMEQDQLSLTVGELLSGETVGVLIAVVAIAFLQRWQTNRSQQLQQS